MNEVSYFEIHVDDVERAIGFYSEVFGWKFIKDERIPIEYYRVEGGGPYGGLLKRQVPKPPPEQGSNAYVCSMHVESFDSVAELIRKHGGLEVVPKFAVVGKCWQGYFSDPEGNTFGIFEPDASAQ